MAHNPRLFTFVIGGMSHHEVVSISNLQQELAAHIVPGSNEIFSSSRFIDELETLAKPDVSRDFSD